jgi:hypothetical protein
MAERIALMLEATQKLSFSAPMVLPVEPVESRSLPTLQRVFLFLFMHTIKRSGEELT